MTFQQFLGIVELRTKVISISTLSLGSFLAFVQSGRFRLEIFLLLFTSALAIDMGTTAFNSFYDYRRGVDQKGRNFESDKVLVHQKLGPGWALITALGCFAVGGLLGLILTIMTSWWLLPLGAASLLVGFLYSGGPRPISSTPLGEFFAGGFLGGLLFILSYFVQTGFWDGDTLLWALPSTLMIASILSVNNICDHKVDLENARLTIVGLFGTGFGKALVLVLGFLSLGILGFQFRNLGIWGIGLTTLALISLGTLYWRLFQGGFSAKSKAHKMRRITEIFLGYSLVFAIGLVLILVLEP